MDLIIQLIEAQGEIFYFVGGFLALLAVLGSLNMMPRNTAASLMISTGIGGTFLGILIALAPLDFSPENINDSIESLLTGMKTAFVTSLLGIGSAIISRFLWALLPKVAKTSPEYKDLSVKLDEIKLAIAGEGDSSLTSQISKLRNDNRDGFKELKEQLAKLDEIKNAIAGEGDSSLANQFSKMRNDNRDGFNELKEQLDKLREENRDGLEKLDAKMAGLADTIKEELVTSLKDLINEIRTIIAEQLTQSLNQLIERIEKALIEQFGKTFVEFNESVQAIKKWQEDHKLHVEQLTVAFQKAAEHLQEIEAGVRKTEETTAKTMESFMALVHNTQEQMLKAGQQMEMLEKQVRTFADMQDKANQAIPEIQKILDEIKKAPDEINNVIEGIVAQWGQRMIPVAEEFAETIKRHRG